MNACRLAPVSEATSVYRPGSSFAARPPCILHLHEQLEGVPTLPYGPPGTDRDNLRDIPAPAFNIEGHGFIACLDANLNWMKPDDG